MIISRTLATSLLCALFSSLGTHIACESMAKKGFQG